MPWQLEKCSTNRDYLSEYQQLYPKSQVYYSITHTRVAHKHPTETVQQMNHNSSSSQHKHAVHSSGGVEGSRYRWTTDHLLHSQQRNGKAGVGVLTLPPTAFATFTCLYNTDHTLNVRQKRLRKSLPDCLYLKPPLMTNQKTVLETKLWKNCMTG